MVGANAPNKKAGIATTAVDAADASVGRTMERSAAESTFVTLRHRVVERLVQSEDVRVIIEEGGPGVEHGRI